MAIGLVSFVLNILMLTGPLFMLQVYDRVLASSSVPTLIVIASIALTLYLFYGILEMLRARILARIGQRADAQLSAVVYRFSNLLPVRLGRQAAAIRPLQDLDTVRQFLSGAGPAAIADIPWLPLYLAIVFLFHPLLGAVALGGAIIISILIVLNEFLARAPVADANRWAGQRAAESEISRRNAEAICAMGMETTLGKRWEDRNASYLITQLKVLDRNSLFSISIKTVRLLLQSAMLGMGAWLAIQQEVTGGVMIASSIMMSRALSPIEQAVQQWRGFVASRQALKRLREGLSKMEEETADMLQLPLPSSTLKLGAVSCGPFGERTPVVSNISFELSAGNGLGIIGPSGSGKSTLVRAIVGSVPALRGSIRFDSSEIAQWPSSRRGDFIGYLPQDLQLFDGTVAENIARFRGDAEADAVIEAARLADVHELITGLPEGYNTVIGTSGYALSGGQRQRIALARALFGNPFLVVLDEPNSNLDSEGEAALSNAIKMMRERGSIVIVVAHRPSAIASVDMILSMKDGQATSFGPKDEVLNRVLAPVPAVAGARA